MQLGYLQLIPRLIFWWGGLLGGTAILYRKCWADKIKIIESHESKITTVQLETNIGPLLLVNVYVPTNYNDDESLQLYINILSQLNSIIIESDTAHTVIAGDFNCDTGSRFFNEFNNFTHDNNLILSDFSRLSTYMSDNGKNMSWLDHILCSVEVDRYLNDVTILNDVIISDHKPVAFTVSCSVATLDTIDHACSTLMVKQRWNDLDAGIISRFELCITHKLQTVNIPIEIYDSTNVDKNVCTLKINQYYNDVMTCLHDYSA